MSRVIRAYPSEYFSGNARDAAEFARNTKQVAIGSLGSPLMPSESFMLGIAAMVLIAFLAYLAYLSKGE